MTADYLFWYKNAENGAFVSSTSRLDRPGLSEVSKAEHDREVRRRENRQADAAAEREAEHVVKLATLAAKLGCTVEDLELLR